MSFKPVISYIRSCSFAYSSSVCPACPACPRFPPRFSNGHFFRYSRALLHFSSEVDNRKKNEKLKKKFLQKWDFQTFTVLPQRIGALLQDLFMNTEEEHFLNGVAFVLFVSLMPIVPFMCRSTFARFYHIRHKRLPFWTQKLVQTLFDFIHNYFIVRCNEFCLEKAIRCALIFRINVISV